jgi:iron complex transport system ATP-binding protein
MIRVENLSFSYGSHEVLRDVSFSIEEGKVTTVLGANGSGKTTLFYLMTKNLVPASGRILLDGADIRLLRLKDFARRAALVNQMHTLGADMTVEQLVALGRTPHRSVLRGASEQDERMIAWALETSGMAQSMDAPLSSLSGGQQQLVWVAMALAQDTPLLFLDEPTTYLDVRYQLRILEMVRALSREHGKTVVMVLHDINFAVRYSDMLIGLKDGELIACGPAEGLLQPDLVEALYGVRLDSLVRDGRTYAWHVERARGSGERPAPEPGFESGSESATGQMERLEQEGSLERQDSGDGRSRA